MVGLSRKTTTVDPTRVKKILVMKWSAMGDLAMAGAPFEDIARAYPEARIDLDTLPPWDTLYREDPRFTHVHCFNLRKGGYKATRDWLRAVAEVGYDLVIDLQTTDRSRSLLALLGLLHKAIPYRAGNKSAFPYNLELNLAPGDSPRHALKIARDTLAAAGIAATADYPRLYVPDEQVESARTLLESNALNPGRFVALLPGCQAAGYLKRWGRDNYIEFARSLLTRGVERIAILGGPDEFDECQAIADGLGESAVNLCGATKLLELPVICEAAMLTVANDTGTAHLASAANKPMVVVCGPTDPRRVLPAGPSVRSAQLDLPCINCYRKHCAHQSCMRLLTPATVMEVAESLVPQLKQVGRNARAESA